MISLFIDYCTEIERIHINQRVAINQENEFKIEFKLDGKGKILKIKNGITKR